MTAFTEPERRSFGLSRQKGTENRALSILAILSHFKHGTDRESLVRVPITPNP